MNLNWTKLGALARTLVILGASSFFGALALPLAADGTLPITWIAWRPILAVAASASAVAEIIWVRTHVQQMAQAIGLITSDASTASLGATPPAVRAALLRIGIGATIVLSLLCVDCTPAQVAQAQTDTQQAIDLTNAVCALAPDSPIGQPYVSVICTLAEGAEQLVSVVIGAVGGLGSTAPASTIARVPVKQIQFKIDTAGAAKFLAAHQPKK